MNNTIKLILAFAGGLVAGGAAMWYYNQSKKDEYREVLEMENECLKGYVDELEKELDIGKKKEDEEMAKFHKEIERVRNLQGVYTPMFVNDTVGRHHDDEEDEMEDLSECELVPAVEEEETHKPVTDPYVISMDEFGEDDYETESLTMYGDGAILNEDEIELDSEEINDNLGMRNLMDMGENGVYTKYIRNDNTHIDYEVVYDYRRYHDDD